MGEWQPIETAPKDGTEIDIWAVQYSVGAGKLITGDGHRISNAWWGEPYYGDERKWEKQLVRRDGAWTEPVEYTGFSVTHWMPLPEPPLTGG